GPATGGANESAPIDTSMDEDNPMLRRCLSGPSLIDSRVHTVGGQGKSGAKPARSRHCDRVEEVADVANRGRRPLGTPIVPGKARPPNPGSQETCPRPAKTTLEERVAHMPRPIQLRTAIACALALCVALAFTANASAFQATLRVV